MKSFFLVALLADFAGAQGMISGGAAAPSSVQTFSSATVTGTLTAGKVAVDYGSPTAPSITFSSDTSLGISHGAYGMRIEGSTTTDTENQLWLKFKTTRVGANADAGDHNNAVFMIGASGSLTKPDMSGTGNTGSNRNYGAYVSPTFGVSEAGHVALNVDHYGLLVAGPISVSTSGAARTVRTQTGIKVEAGINYDANTTIQSAYSLFLDSPTYNPLTTTVYSLYAHGPAWFVDNDAHIGIGADKAESGAIRTRNGLSMVTRNAAANGDLHLIGTDGGTNDIRIGTTSANAVFLQGVVSIGNVARSTFAANGNLTLPYGLVVGTITASDNISVTKANGRVDVTGTAATVSASGGGTVSMSVLNLAGNEGLLMRHTSGDAYSDFVPYSGGVAGHGMVLMGGSGGGMGIGVVPSLGILHVDKGTGVGQATLDGSTGGCIMLRDTDDAGWTECDALDGTLSCSIDADGLCD